jgi:hypothetical protein
LANNEVLKTGVINSINVQKNAPQVILLKQNSTDDCTFNIEDTEASKIFNFRFY